jgi:hypothetical protein
LNLDHGLIGLEIKGGARFIHLQKFLGYVTCCKSQKVLVYLPVFLKP